MGDDWVVDESGVYTFAGFLNRLFDPLSNMTPLRFRCAYAIAAISVRSERRRKRPDGCSAGGGMLGGRSIQPCRLLSRPRPRGPVAGTALSDLQAHQTMGSRLQLNYETKRMGPWDGARDGA